MLLTVKIRSAFLGSALIAAMAAGAAALPAHADSPESVLYSFDYSGFSAYQQGNYPDGELTTAPDGSYYLTTSQGGANIYGSVVKIAPDGTVKVLHSFGVGKVGGVADGENPRAGITVAPDGMLYGTTIFGGAYNRGTIFSMTPDGKETILHSFSGGLDGEIPESAIAIGKDGRLYGTTGGGKLAPYGTIYSIYPGGAYFVTQYRFDKSTGPKFGEGPNGDLTPGLGSDMALYGTASAGGAYGQGTVYAFTPGYTDGTGTLTVLHTFLYQPGASYDGANPAYGPLQFDTAGNLYGSTAAGGLDGGGTVFKIDSAQNETILHNFDAGAGGLGANGGVTLASDGNLYGTTQYGGSSAVTSGGAGLIYSLSPSEGSFNIVHTFQATSDDPYDASLPQSRPIEDGAGNLLGASVLGGDANDPGNNYLEGGGTVYKVAAGLPPLSLAAVSVTPSDLTGGSERVTGTVTMSSPAPTGGARIVLSSSDPRVVEVGSAVHVPQGQTTATFNVQSLRDASSTTVTISASYNGSTVTTPITVTPMPAIPELAAVVLSPATQLGGAANGDIDTVYLTGPATANTEVTVTSSDPSVADVVGTPLTVHQGATSYIFHLVTSNVATTQTVTITASLNGISKSAVLTVNPAPHDVSSVSLPNNNVIGGAVTTDNRVHLNGAPNVDTVVTLTSSNPAVASVPSKVVVHAGYTSHVFTITTSAVNGFSYATITATSPDGVSSSDTIYVSP